MTQRSNVIDLQKEFSVQGEQSALVDPFAGYDGPSFKVSDIRLCDGTKISVEDMRTVARSFVDQQWRPKFGL